MEGLPQAANGTKDRSQARPGSALAWDHAVEHSPHGLVPHSSEDNASRELDRRNTQCPTVTRLCSHDILARS